MDLDKEDSPSQPGSAPSQAVMGPTAPSGSAPPPTNPSQDIDVEERETHTKISSIIIFKVMPDIRKYLR